MNVAMATGVESGEVSAGPATIAPLEPDSGVPTELAEVGCAVDDAGCIAKVEATPLTATEAEESTATAPLEAEAPSVDAAASFDAVSVEASLPDEGWATSAAVETEEQQQHWAHLQLDEEEQVEKMLQTAGDAEAVASKSPSSQRSQERDDDVLNSSSLHDSAALLPLGTSIKEPTSKDMQKDEEPNTDLPSLDANEVGFAESSKAQQVEQASQEWRQSLPPTSQSQAQRGQELPQAPSVQASTSSVSMTVTAEELRRLEVRARELRAGKSQAEAKLEAAQALSSQLEAKWAKISATADDALRRTDEAQQQTTMLRRAAEEKDSRLAQVIDAAEQLQEANRLAEHRLKQLEASFRERVERDISQKEQELLEDVAYLRKSIEIKERRAQEASEEKAKLERRLAERGGGEARGPNDAAMLEAHSTIARAFADVSASPPLLKLFDEPLLKITGMLFKQPLVRRGFFALSGVMWLYALLHALAFDGGPSIHV